MASVRELILNQAELALELSEGKSLSVQQLCEQAGVSRTSFYREFSNADDVVATLTANRWKECVAELAARASVITDPRDCWYEFLMAMAQEFLREAARQAGGGLNPHLSRLMYRNEGRHFKEIVAAMAPLIEKWQVTGFIRTDVFIEELADWILRQIWAMTSIPFASDDQQQALEHWLTSFVLPSLQPQAPAADPVATGDQRLDQLAAAIRRIEEKLATL